MIPFKFYQVKYERITVVVRAKSTMQAIAVARCENPSAGEFISIRQVSGRFPPLILEDGREHK